MIKKNLLLFIFLCIILFINVFITKGVEMLKDIKKNKKNVRTIVLPKKIDEILISTATKNKIKKSEIISDALKEYFKINNIEIGD